MRPLASRSRRLAALAFLTLLPITSLVAQAGRGTLTGKITDVRNGAPLAGARVTLGASQIGATSNASGVYRLFLPSGRSEVRFAAIGYGLHRDTVNVADGATVTRDVSLEREAVTLSEIATIGSRNADRTSVSSPVPVDILTSEDIKLSGRTETAQILQMLAPSFNFPRPSLTDGTDNSRPATLRGLAPDQVLVLVNGKRRHTSSLINLNTSIGRGSGLVDINAIPASAIDHIEILRDGAAAQYGSDAIAGVINIVLKGNTANELAVQAGGYNTTFKSSVDADRKLKDGKNVTTSGTYSLALGQNGFATLSVEYRDRNFTNRSSIDGRTQYFAGSPKNTDPLYSNRIDHRYGDPNTRDAVGFLNIAKQLGTNTEFYSTIGYGDRNGDAAGFWRRALDDRTVRSIYPDGFLPLIESTVRDASALGGVRGIAGTFKYDASLTWGRNSYRYDIIHTANVSLGNASPTEFYAGTTGFNQLTANLDLVRQFEIGASSPLNVAFGAEYRRDGYSIKEGEPDSWRDGGVRVLDGPGTGNVAAAGAQVFPGFRPADATNAHRSDVAGYVDLEVNPFPALLLGVAGRAEHYSDFGGKTTGKATARLELTKGVAVRGAASTGFRAPSLGQSFFTSTATNFINGVPFEIKTFPVASAAGKLLGATDLKPETSVNLSAGLALSPTRNLSLTVDYYHIAIDNRVVLSGNFTDVTVRNFLAANGFPGVGGGRYFTNAIDTKTKGVDIIVGYGVPLGASSNLRLTAGYNANSTKVTRISSTPPVLAAFQSVLFDRSEQIRVEKGQPKSNLNLQGVLSAGKATVTLRGHRYGEVTTYATTLANAIQDQTFGAKWITDVSVAYRVLSQLTLSVGADNIGDVYPDMNSLGNATTSGNSNFGIFPYSSVSPFGFNGRYLYGRAALVF
ncbi:MAG: TonB-dependent receptor [Gemmatimonadota bacterium]